MQFNEFGAALKSALGIPVAYYQFPEGDAPGTPFAIYYVEDNDDVFGDDENFQEVINVTIELYTDKKDLQLERVAKSFLRSQEIAYAKSDQPIESEGMHETIFLIQLIGEDLDDDTE